MQISDFELQHYSQLQGGTIQSVRFCDFEGQPCAVLFVAMPGGSMKRADVWCDPEGNGPGYLAIEDLA